VALETGASGLVVFTQDWRTQRKLTEDMATMEHELIAEVHGEVTPEALLPIERALRDPRHHLPHTKVSVGSSGPQGSKLRILGPIELAGQFEWYALTVQPGGALESTPHEGGTREHLTVHAGSLDVSAGEETQRLKPGETARYAADRPHTIRNAGKTVVSAWLVVVHPA